jgi:D-beta-D-heptose 7-phosphate kinase/D-beta-D-heptose 1-phosphate adenosyltransferase
MGTQPNFSTSNPPATFAFCKAHADVLVVGLNSDDSVRRQQKDSNRPIVGQDDRATLLSALSDIDYVVIFDDDTPLSLIEAIKPDVLVKGGDWEGKAVVGREVVESNGGKVLFVPMVEGLSTTELINRIRDPA